MTAVLSLPELQRDFLAALYDAADAGPVAAIAGNGLSAAARLRVYRHSCEASQTDALRTAYPGVLALVGEAWFDQTAHGYRRAWPSTSGNLQAFGAHLGDYIAALPPAGIPPYLADVARLEWLRQRAVLAPAAPLVGESAASLPRGADVRITFDPSLHLFASHHAVLTIWRYAMQPTAERLQLRGEGENVLLWREEDAVVMAAVDAASFACIASLASGATLRAAGSAGTAIVADFDTAACVGSLIDHDLVTAIRPEPDTPYGEPT